MYEKTLQATHPEMMRGVDNATLAERYLVRELFGSDALRLTYCHVERFVIGGAMPVRSARNPPRRSGAIATSSICRGSRSSAAM